MPTLARKDVLPEGSVFSSQFETINNEPFFASGRRKRLVLDTLEKSRNKAEGQVIQMGLLVLDERYIAVLGLLGEPGFYSKWMQSAHTSLAGNINRQEKRKGHLGSRRPSTHPVGDEECLKRLLFATDYLPVYVGLVDSPEQFRDSTYQYYARGKKMPSTDAITRPPFYQALGTTDEERQRAYRKLGRQYYRQGLLNDYMRALLVDRPLGSEKYRRERSRYLNEVSRRERLKRAGGRALEAIGWYAFCPTAYRVSNMYKALGALVMEVVAPGPDPPRPLK